LPAQKSPNTGVGSAPLAPAGTPAPAEQKAEDDASKRKVRAVGPAFYPVR
jgi:hypothetical protein